MYCANMADSPKGDDELLTIKEAAKYVKVHKETIRRWYLREGLPGLKRGKTLRFTRGDLVNFLKEDKPRR